MGLLSDAFISDRHTKSGIPKSYSEGAIRLALGPRFTHLWSKRTTSNTLESDNTITTVKGLVNFLWQMIVCC